MAVERLYQNSVENRTAGYMPVFGQKKPENAASFASELSKTAPAETAKTAPQQAVDGAEEKDPGGFLSFLFGILDVLNPLQHIPVVSTIYRHLTGDEISPMARIAGGALYGGPIGAAASVVNVAVEKSTGKDIGDTVLAMVTGDDERQAPVMTASAMNSIAPASGIDIIWADEPAQAAPQPAALAVKEIPLSTLPHPQHPAAELQTASYSYKAAPPDLPSKGALSASVFLTATERGAGEETPVTPRADTLLALHPQSAPADDARTAQQPELIAYKMMAALDKYSAMKQRGL